MGTDHGNGGISLVMGGAVKGRLVAGGYTSEVTEPDIEVGVNYLPFERDFRDIYGHIVENHLGVDADGLFPDPAYTPNFGSLDLI